MPNPDLTGLKEAVAALRREPLAAISSLDGTVKEPLVCLTVPERDTILSLLEQLAEAREALGEIADTVQITRARHLARAALGKGDGHG